MIIVAGTLKVDPVERERFLEASRSSVQQARSAKGCLAFALSPDLIQADRVVVLERWSDRASLEVFRNGGPESGLDAFIRAYEVEEFEVAAPPDSSGLRAALAAVPVSDIDLAESWYADLLGHGPSARPMAGLVEWYSNSHGGLQLVVDMDRAGGGLATLQVTDLGAFVVGAVERGVEIEAPSAGGEVASFVTVTDPDGNAVTLVEV